MAEMTRAQRELLLDLSDCQGSTIYCEASYKPALALVNSGLAQWLRAERLSITDAGRTTLSASQVKP